MRSRKTCFKKVNSLFLAMLLLFGTVTASAATLTETKNQQVTLEVQKKANDVLLVSLRENTEKKTEYKALLEEQIRIVKEQLDQCVADTAVLNKALTAAKAVSVDTLDAKARVTHAEKLRALEAAHRTAAVALGDMEYKNKELDALYAEAQALLEDADQTEKRAKARAESIAREKAETDAAIDAWYAEYKEKQAAVGGNTGNLGGDSYMGTEHFIWPMPGYTAITQYYGDGGDHRGVDIAGSEIYGKAIVAADKGTVAYAGWMGSYGYVVFVDHGNGYQTRYAHMSALGSSEGDVVASGQVIGYVGSTGNSSGPHLHFEILYDGSVQNPFLYF